MQIFPLMSTQCRNFMEMEQENREQPFLSLSTFFVCDLLACRGEDVTCDRKNRIFFHADAMYRISCRMDFLRVIYA